MTDSQTVDLGEAVAIFVPNVPVEDGQVERSEGCEGGVVEDDSEGGLVANARETGEEGVGVLNKCVEDVLQEDEERCQGDSTIEAMTVDQQHACEEAELADGVVRAVDGLRSLLADDAHSNMRSPDHLYVICAVTNCQCDHLSIFLADETGEFGFLVFASTTGNDCLAGLRHNEELDVRWVGNEEPTAFLQATAK